MVHANLKTECILILGATASGKTALAHKIADDYKSKGQNCELVNLDAFQIYTQLTIGTAKPTQAEIKKYHYHGVNICKLQENLDANSFAKIARNACEEIQKRNHLPICVGGSGLYLRAFLHGLDDLPVRDEIIRQDIQEIANTYGWPYCHEWLKKVDPLRAAELHPNDKTRIERSLEIFLITGIPQSEQRSKEAILKDQNTLFPCYVIYCKRDKEELKKRILKRVEILFAQGWQKEVEKLYTQYGEEIKNFHSMQAIGYKQILESLHTQISQKELIQKISTLTWQYAKKQITWCAKEKIDEVFEDSE